MFFPKWKKKRSSLGTSSQTESSQMVPQTQDEGKYTVPQLKTGHLKQLGLPSTLRHWDSHQRYGTGTPINVTALGLPSTLWHWDSHQRYGTGTPINVTALGLPSIGVLLQRNYDIHIISLAGRYMFGSSEQSLATNHELEELREVLIAAKITRQPCWQNSRNTKMENTYRNREKKNQRGWHLSTREGLGSQQDSPKDPVKADDESYTKNVLVFDLSSLLNSIADAKPTKRNIIGVCARIYDPLGFLSPFTVQTLFQEIYVANVDRDEPLTTETAREMELLTVELEAVIRTQLTCLQRGAKNVYPPGCALWLSGPAWIQDRNFEPQWTHPEDCFMEMRVKKGPTVSTLTECLYESEYLVGLREQHSHGQKAEISDETLGLGILRNQPRTLWKMAVENTGDRDKDNTEPEDAVLPYNTEVFDNRRTRSNPPRIAAQVAHYRLQELALD
ncbi:hypothetical protein EMCRGX_G034301 [Ephydatia muelleri]